MFLQRTTAFAAIALAIAFGSSNGLLAQDFATTPPPAQPEQTTQREGAAYHAMMSGVGQLAADFWTTHLNAYKVRVDKIVSPGDRMNLDAMRAHFGILIAELKGGSSDRESENFEADVKGSSHDGEVDLDDVENLYKTSLEYRSRYKTQLDQLKSTVLKDFSEFLGLVMQHMQTYARTHREELAADPAGASILKEMDSLNAGKPFPIEEVTKQASDAYEIIEPIILLYNGTDLRSMFNLTGATASSIPELAAIPESNVLMQNLPNPASGTTKISYTIGQECSPVLRVYSSAGTLVNTLNQGSQQQGTHTINLDVSGYTPGTYLYQITVQGAGGEEVYSKVMQVVR